MLQLAIKAGKFPMTSVYQFGSDEALHAAPLPPKPSRGAFPPEKPNRQPREVPASVMAAAAAVGQAVNPVSSAPTQQSAGSTSRPAAGGSSVWVTAPEGVSAEARLAVRLPESEFTYIDRPWLHFLSRWAAIDDELQKCFGEEAFTMLDMGSCAGFFSLQAAVAYPAAMILGVEGSVGIGNGTIGVDGSQEKIIASKGIQTHLRWIQRLNLRNCLVAPDVWDFHKVATLASKQSYLCDVMLLLSVVHHMDNVSFQQYSAKGLTRVEGSLQLMANLLQLAPRHFVELPDEPWLSHVYERFGTAQDFLRAAAELSGKKWQFTGPLVISEWYGRRELWLMETNQEALPMLSLEAIFPKLLPLPQASPASQASQASAAPAPVQQAAPVQAPPAAAPAAPAVPAVPHPSVVPPAFTSLSWQEELGRAMLKAPTSLIAAHLALRDAMISAEAALRETTREAAPAPGTEAWTA